MDEIETPVTETVVEVPITNTIDYTSQLSEILGELSSNNENTETIISNQAEIINKLEYQNQQMDKEITYFQMFFAVLLISFTFKRFICSD